MSITMIILQHLLPAKCLCYWVRVPLQPYLSHFLFLYSVTAGESKPSGTTVVRNYFIRTVRKVFCVLFSNLFIILKIQRDKQTLLNHTFHFNRKYFFVYVLKSFQADLKFSINN